jgi:hypothetical protein
VVDLDHINLRLLTTGATLMSAALVVGYVYWVHDRQSGLVFKILITGSIWAAYALALILRWRGILITKRLAWSCIALFVAALFSLGIVESSRTTPTAAPIASQRLP